eukprot:jgi/Ulvmu1/7109/UM034_0015.1
MHMGVRAVPRVPLCCTDTNTAILQRGQQQACRRGRKVAVSTAAANAEAVQGGPSGYDRMVSVPAGHWLLAWRCSIASMPLQQHAQPTITSSMSPRHPCHPRTNAQHSTAEGTGSQLCLTSTSGRAAGPHL